MSDSNTSTAQQRREAEYRRLKRYASRIRHRVGDAVADAVVKAAKEYIEQQYQKRIAQQYQGDPSDYNNMVANVAATLEKIAERLNAAGVPALMWQNAIDDLLETSEFSEVISDTPALGGDLNEIKEEAAWFVDKMLKQYSNQWKQEYTNRGEQLADGLMSVMYNSNLPPASQEDIESGAYIPGVDYSMIEKLLLSWKQEIEPMLMQATDQYLQDIKTNFERQAEGMNALFATLRKRHDGDEIIREIQRDIHNHLSNEYGYDRDFMPMLRQFQASNMPAIMTSMHMAGNLDAYGFSYRNSSLVDYYSDHVLNEYPEVESEE